VKRAAACLVAGRGSLEGALHARIVGVGVQEELGAAIVAGRPQIIVARADLVALLELAFCFVGEPVGEGAVGIVPAVVVAGLDVLGDGDDLAELGAAIFGRAK
jgi:nitrous oxidase accessory protein NosD